MSESVVGKLLQRAVDNNDFRRRALRDLGTTLAEEGFILTDSEMAVVRGYWESLQGISDRAAYERLVALARRPFH